MSVKSNPIKWGTITRRTTSLSTPTSGGWQASKILVAHVWTSATPPLQSLQCGWLQEAKNLIYRWLTPNQAENLWRSMQLEGGSPLGFISKKVIQFKTVVLGISATALMISSHFPKCFGGSKSDLLSPSHPHRVLAVSFEEAQLPNSCT